MNAFRRHLQAFARIAVLAAWGWAVLPAWMHAHAGTRGDWVEVCTPQGTRLVAVTAGEPGELSVEAQVIDEHCAFCAHTSSLHPGEPPAHRGHVARTEGLLQAGLAAAPLVARAWPAAQPRGPPIRGWRCRCERQPPLTSID